MSLDLAPSRDLGLQHVLKDGLAILSEAPLPTERREQVLTKLLEIVEQASRGSQALKTQKLALSNSARPEFEKFALFSRYLENAPISTELSSRLSEASKVLSVLQQGNRGDTAERSRAKELISNLLAAIERESNYAALVKPRALFSSF